MNKIGVDIISNEECESRIINSQSQIQIDDTLVCVKPQDVDMCKVDPGGPLACENDQGFYEVVGVYTQENICGSTINQVNF